VDAWGGGRSANRKEGELRSEAKKNNFTPNSKRRAIGNAQSFKGKGAAEETYRKIRFLEKKEKTIGKISLEVTSFSTVG